MEKTISEEHPSPLVIAAETEPVTLANTPKSAQIHQFNEQTNYVPRKTIITVSKPGGRFLCFWGTPRVTVRTDFFGMC
ncbi:hypothetical protein F4782DRAFT_116602 [Xylaria castorea]|nr:hypothetical protein F4782DRAFT_116602 [Xylaria castorea]